MAESRDEWTRSPLERRGFRGWLTADQLLKEPRAVPSEGGVYVVLRVATSELVPLELNPGGRFKDKDPTVPEQDLRANWVAGAQVVYIGKADNLRRRLRQYVRFGAGVPIGHWGGRLIWQLRDSKELLFAWSGTPTEDPQGVEKGLIEEFRAAFGKPPFANEPHRLGR